MCLNFSPDGHGEADVVGEDAISGDRQKVTVLGERNLAIHSIVRDPNQPINRLERAAEIHGMAVDALTYLMQRRAASWAGGVFLLWPIV